LYETQAFNHILCCNEIAGAAFHLKTDDAIADSGATQFFVMEGTPVVDKRKTTHPLKVSFADGHQVISIHMCDIHIKGLLVVLTVHIIPDLSIAHLLAYVC
jgi:hypothetical protein